MMSAPRISGFGLVDGGEDTLYATWSWPYDHIDHFEVQWIYYTGNINNDGNMVWFTGNSGTTTEKQSTYSIPNNASGVKFRVKPVSQTYKVNDQDVSYWVGGWSADESYYRITESDKMKVPSTPNVTIDKYTITAKISGTKLNTSRVQFELWAPGYYMSEAYSRKVVKTLQDYEATCTFTITPGYKYKVRCRSIPDSYSASDPFDENFASDWSEFSGEVVSVPSAPSQILTCRAESETSVYLTWTDSVGAKTYEIEYSTNRDYFDKNDQTTKQSGIEHPYYLLVGLDAGQEYFFRVRASNDQGTSDWCSIQSVVIGKAPAAPTTWSSTSTLMVGEKLLLYWVHNSVDSSSQTFAELSIDINGQSKTYTIKNDRSDDDKDKTSTYELDTSNLVEGATILWKVRTAGVTKVYGDWSVQREVKVYAPPTLELKVLNQNGDDITTLTSFPFSIKAIAGPNTQTPIGYHVSIKATSAYETVDNVGNVELISVGEEVYAKYFDTKTTLDVILSANDVDLQNNVTYDVVVTVSMNTGLTCTETSALAITWSEDGITPNAQITFDRKTMACYISPYCEKIVENNYLVEYKNGNFVRTNTKVDIIKRLFDDTHNYTTDEKPVYRGKANDGKTVYYCDILEKQNLSNYTLSIYRREFDGSFTEIATGLDNSRTTYATDPHPSLDIARYRIVSMSKDTGAISFVDLPGYPINEKSVIIQWDEQWSWFNAEENRATNVPWTGSMLKLPYDIDVSDKNSPDSTLVKYAGRKSPVSYYGTHISSSLSVSVNIPKTDKETLYAIRRLSAWLGDVYVREPSGIGYWANISVSYNVTHKELIVPISFEITKVEGGV